MAAQVEEQEPEAPLLDRPIMGGAHGQRCWVAVEWLCWQPHAVGWGECGFRGMQGEKSTMACRASLQSQSKLEPMPSLTQGWSSLLRSLEVEQPRVVKRVWVAAILLDVRDADRPGAVECTM